MNERIQQLAEQAEILITDVGAFHNTPTGAYQLKGEHLAKFAELIVWECAHLVGGYTKENEFGTDVKEAYEEITKHFGVKE